MYKTIKPINEVAPQVVVRVADGAWIPFDPQNQDYANFKAKINAGEAQLEDADGNLMSADAAKAYVAGLP